MAKMREAELKQIVSNAITTVSGGDESDRNRNHEQALDYYWGRMPANKPGRSQVVSTDVADMIEAIMAQLMPSFTNDQLGSFEPVSEEDVKAAEEESIACNYVIMEQNNGFIQFASAIKSALLKRNAVIRVEVEEKTDSDTQRYEGLTAQELDRLMEPIEPKDGITITTEHSEIEEVNDLINMTVKTTTTKQRLVVDGVDPSLFLIDSSYTSYDLQQCGLTGEERYYTRSDLLELGFSKAKIKDLHAVHSMPNYVASAKHSQGNAPISFDGDESSEVIQVYRMFIKVDYDGDGVAELREIWLAGGLEGTIIRNEPRSTVPYALGVVFIMPYTWEGVSLFDKLKDVQQSKTQTLRQWTDNGVNANYGRLGVVEDQVNYADIMNAVPGGIVRMRSADSVVPLPTVDVGASASAHMAYMDKVRTDKGGASLDMQGAEAQIAGDTARGIDRQFTSKEQLCELMAQTLAESLIKQTFLLVHRTLREQSTVPIILRRGDEWLTASPQEWQERERVNATLGASLTQRDRIMNNIEKMIGFGVQLKQMGMATTMQDAQGMYQAIKDWTFSANLNNPDAYWIDPSSKKGQELAKQAMESSKQQAQAAAQMQDQIIKAQQQIEQMKEQGEMTRAVIEQQFKYFQEWIRAEIEEAKLVGSATLDLNRAQVQGQIGAQGNGSGTV